MRHICASQLETGSDNLEQISYRGIGATYFCRGRTPLRPGTRSPIL